MAEPTFYNLITELEAYLQYERDEGTLRMEVEASTLEALSASTHTATSSTSQGEAPAVEETAKIPSTFESIDAMRAYAKSCRHCTLCQTRIHTVFGEGNFNEPDILFVGEEPSLSDDSQGIPFTGKDGALLTKMIGAMGYKPGEVCITNAIKCCPPNKRMPSEDELAACRPYLQQQIAMIKPKVIVALGATAIKMLFGKTAGIIRLRGNWQEYEGIKVMPTFHPSYMIRKPSEKKVVWQDLQLVLKSLGRTPPPRAK